MRRKELVLLLATLFFCAFVIMNSPSRKPDRVTSFKPVVQEPRQVAVEDEPLQPQTEPDQLDDFPQPSPSPARPVANAIPVGTNNHLNQDEAPGKTTYKCYRSVDWAEVCVYHNLCHDGNKVVFFDDTKKPMSDVLRFVLVICAELAAGQLTPAPAAVIRTRARNLTVCAHGAGTSALAMTPWATTPSTCFRVHLLPTRGCR